MTTGCGIDCRVHDDSDAGVGFCVELGRTAWGTREYAVGFYLGHFLLSISLRRGVSFCSCYATGCGG